MKIKIITIFLVLAIISMIVFIVFLSNNNKESSSNEKKTDTIIKVKIAKVNRGSISQRIETTGEINARNSVKISSKVEGIIRYFPWHDGDSINAGDKVFEIDDSNFVKDIKLAEASLKVAKAKYDDLRYGVRDEEKEKDKEALNQAISEKDFAKADYERVSALVKKGALPSEEADKASLKLKQAEAKLIQTQQQLKISNSGPTVTSLKVQEAFIEEANAKLEVVKENLLNCSMNAPFRGKFSKVFVTVGDLARPGLILAELTDLSSLVIRFSIPEKYIPFIKINSKLLVSFDAFPERQFESNIISLLPNLDDKTRSMIAEASTNFNFQIFPGMFVRIKLILQEKKDVISIPKSTKKLSTDNKNIVFIFKDSKAIENKIVTGLEDDENIEVQSGLMEGDSIITSGIDVLKDGVTVKVEGDKEIK